jgi:hypothetical protein
MTLAACMSSETRKSARYITLNTLISMSDIEFKAPSVEKEDFLERRE